MANTTEKKKRFEGIHSNRRESLVATGLGIVAGSISRSLTMEVFAHQQLAHHTLRMKPWLEKTSRVIFATYGLSANKFALRHRKHHRTDHIEAQDGIFESIRGAFEASGTHEHILDPADDLARHWSHDEYFEDPLSTFKNDMRVLRHNPLYERMVARGGVIGAMVPIAGFTALCMATKIAGSKRPVRSAAYFAGGSLLMMGVQPGLTAYAEVRSGITDVRINTSRIKQPLRSKVVRHDQHHEKPWRYDLGITPIDHIVIGLGKALGQIEDINDGMTPEVSLP